MTAVKKQLLIVLCRDLPTIRAITEATGRHFELIWARDGRNWSNSVGDQEVAAAILDNSAAADTSIQLFQSIQKNHPQVRRVLITDYCDLSIIVQGLHTGAVQKIVYKPIHAPELLAALGAPAHHAVAPASMAGIHETRIAG